MAQKVQVVLEDDLDGGTADETVVFGLDGTSYEIDLTKKNAAKLRDALAPWVAAGRRTGGSRGGARRGRGRAARGSQAGDVRAWARANGYQVSERGRISAEIQAPTRQPTSGLTSRVPAERSGSGVGGESHRRRFRYSPTPTARCSPAA